MRILSWNVAGDDISAQSPPGWTLASKEDLIVETILGKQPDLITLQELTGNDILIQLQSAGYDRIAGVDAHIGKTYLFARYDPKIRVEKVFEIGPALMVILNIAGSEPFGFIGCHFPPFKENVEARKHLISQIVRELSKRVERYIICGDMNMREGETDYTVSNLQLEDAFLKADRPAQYKFSWDGYLNPFHRDKYTHPFNCRFDRILYHNLKLRKFQFCGDKPASDNAYHFLSDHFGLVADVDFE